MRIILFFEDLTKDEQEIVTKVINTTIHEIQQIALDTWNVSQTYYADAYIIVSSKPSAIAGIVYQTYSSTQKPIQIITSSDSKNTLKENGITTVVSYETIQDLQFHIQAFVNTLETFIHRLSVTTNQEVKNYLDWYSRRYNQSVSRSVHAILLQQAKNDSNYKYSG